MTKYFRIAILCLSCVTLLACKPGVTGRPADSGARRGLGAFNEPTTATVTLAGDVTGAANANTVAKVNGATVGTAGGALSTNTVLKATGASTIDYSQVVNADVSASAAVAGTKISPNFGSQNIVTTGTGSLGSTPAAAGTLALPNSFTVTARNAANNADLGIASGDGANNLYVGGVGIPNLFLYTAGAERFAINSTTTQFFETLQTNDGAWVQNLWTGSANTQTSTNTHVPFRCRTLVQTPVTCGGTFTLVAHHGAAVIVTATGRTIVGGGGPWNTPDVTMSAQKYADVYYDGTTGTLNSTAYIYNGSPAGMIDVAISTSTVTIRVLAAPVSGGSNPTVDWQGDAWIVSN